MTKIKENPATCVDMCQGRTIEWPFLTDIQTAVLSLDDTERVGPFAVTLAINSRTLMRVPAVLEQHSIEPLEFMASAGLSPNLFLGGPRWLARDFCFRLVDQAAKMTGNPFFGAQVGSMIELSDLGPFGADILSASTLEQALYVAQHELRRVHSGAALRIEKTPREMIIHFQFQGRLGADPLQYDLGSIAVLQTIAKLTGTNDGVRFNLASPYTMASGALEAYFGGDLSFGASSNAMVIDRELLELPLVPPKRSSPPDLYYVTSTAELIKQFLPDGEANLKHIATILRTNERTLQRKLAKFGVTFEHLVDITRRDEAIRLITQSSERMANVAFRLGYSEQANFNRAFRRWTGNQPRVYRRDNA